MGDCNETLKELERFLDHELTPATREVVQHHLDGCLDCLSAFDFHAELKIVIAEKLRREQLPDGLRARIESCFGDLTDDE